MMHAKQDGFAAEIRKAELAQGGLARAGRRLSEWLRAQRAAREHRRAGRLLARMDEHLLRDIGVTRDEAERLARGVAED